ncbi:hypothetical protein VCB98_09920, partial [Gammaproteobacteria bacterium AB-CW1]|nr:hypothetical protein [Gammaproteobacteria bacterium AB-CW1]
MPSKGVSWSVRGLFLLFLVVTGIVLQPLFTQSGPTRIHDAIWLVEPDKVTVIASDSGEQLFEMVPVDEIQAI